MLNSFFNVHQTVAKIHRLNKTKRRKNSLFQKWRGGKLRAEKRQISCSVYKLRFKFAIQFSTYYKTGILEDCISNCIIVFINSLLGGKEKLCLVISTQQSCCKLRWLNFDDKLLFSTATDLRLSDYHVKSPTEIPVQVIPDQRNFNAILCTIFYTTASLLLSDQNEIPVFRCMMSERSEGNLSPSKGTGWLISSPGVHSWTFWRMSRRCPWPMW